GNIAQEIKWSAEEVAPTLAHYQKLSASHWDSQIIIWPEVAIPLPLEDAKDFLNTMTKQANAHHATLITGIPIKLLDKDGYYNAVITLGAGTGQYAKRRLVPFGEYTPSVKIIQTFFEKFNIPMSNLVPGKNSPEPLVINGI